MRNPKFYEVTPVGHPSWRPAKTEQERRLRRCRRLRQWLGLSIPAAATMTWRTSAHVSMIENAQTNVNTFEQYRRELVFLGDAIRQRRAKATIIRRLWHIRRVRDELIAAGISHPDGKIE